MAYSDFALDDIKTQFQLARIEDKRLFSDVTGTAADDRLVVSSNQPAAYAFYGSGVTETAVASGTAGRDTLRSWSVSRGG